MNALRIVRAVSLTAIAFGTWAAHADYFVNWQVKGTDVPFAYAAVQATGEGGYSAMLMDASAKLEGIEWEFISANDGATTTEIAQGQFTPREGLDVYSFQMQLFDEDYNLIAFSDLVGIDAFGSEGFRCINTSLSGLEGEGVWQVDTFHTVPEPTSGVLLLLGVAGLALKRRRC